MAKPAPVVLVARQVSRLKWEVYEGETLVYTSNRGRYPVEAYHGQRYSATLLDVVAGRHGGVKLQWVPLVPQVANRLVKPEALDQSRNGMNSLALESLSELGHKAMAACADFKVKPRYKGANKEGIYLKFAVQGPGKLADETSVLVLADYLQDELGLNVVVSRKKGSKIIKGQGRCMAEFGYIFFNLS